MEAATLVLNEIETAVIGEDSTSSTSRRIQSELATAYALLGNADRALSALEKVPDYALPLWTLSAASLCDANKRQDGLLFLERAKSLTKQLHADNYAAIALAYARCKEADKARKFFLRARDSADNTDDCFDDTCGDFKNQAWKQVSEKIIHAGMFDLVTGWPDPGLDDKRALHLALALALSGAKAESTSRTAALEKKYEGKSDPRWQSEIALVKAETSLINDEQAQAIRMFEVAFRNAKALDDSNSRARALAAVAQVQTKWGLCGPAQATLREARLAADVTRLRDAPSDYYGPTEEVYALIAHGFARCGFDAEAEVASNKLLDDAAASIGHAQLSALFAERVTAEVAVAIAARNKTKAVSMLAELAPSGAKLYAAMRIEALESKQVLPDGLRIARKFVEEEKEKAADYFLAAQDDFERRIMIGHFSEMMRRQQTDKRPSLSDLFALLIAESARIESNNWRARALCELGYSARVVGRDDDSRRLFDQGLAVAKEGKSGFLTYSSPSGACAFWLKRAGENASAQAAADQPIQWMRAAIKDGFIREADSGTLLGLAISYEEAENGEIQIESSALDWVLSPRVYVVRGIRP